MTTNGEEYRLYGHLAHLVRFLMVSSIYGKRHVGVLHKRELEVEFKTPIYKNQHKL